MYKICFTIIPWLRKLKISQYARYHNSRRLLPDYTPGMSTSIETRINVQSNHSNEDASVIVDMDDIQKNKKSSERRSNVNSKNRKESISFHYEASLILNNVKPNQSGNYTCGPSNSLSASVRLHITQGKYNQKCSLL